MSTKTKATYRNVRISTQEGQPLEALEAGDTLYLATITDGREQYTEASVTPFTTNQSGEERIIGWCGNTNGVDVHAIGRARLVSITGDEYTNDGMERDYWTAKVRLEREGEEFAPTFAVVREGFAVAEFARIEA